MGRLPFTYKDLIPFVEPVMDHPRDVEKLARLVWAILAARCLAQGAKATGSARKSDWARHYRKEAGERTNYKAIERLIEGLEPERFLHRLIEPGTPFVLVDPTEIPRPKNGVPFGEHKATRTPCVGRLKDGRLGFTAFLMAQPYQGRAIPVYVGVYSEAILNEGTGGRNLAWRSFVWDALRYVEPETVWVFDLEFSFAGWLEDLEDAGVRYVMRLAAGRKAYLEDKEGRRLPLVVPRGGQVVWEGVRYRVGDSVSEVNVVGVWEGRHREPLWVMGNLPLGVPLAGKQPGELFGVYWQRMKIEEAFRDLKGYLRMEGVMSKTLENAEKTLRLLAFAYALGLVVGETMRQKWREKGGAGWRKWRDYSGLFLLLKMPGRFSLSRWKEALQTALGEWRRRLFPCQQAIVGT